MAERRVSMSPPPSKLPRLSGSDPNDDAAGAVTVAAASPVLLMLGLGVGGSGSDSSGADEEASAAAAAAAALTFMQRQELEQQALIYRYFAAGYPVPVELVLPVWTSVAASSSGHESFPSLMGLGSLCFDRRGSAEAEPGRCRRTDGKKWRCTRAVVDGGHKYCERHIHRGRGRSRKPVEAASTTPAIPIRAVPAAADALAPSPPPPPPQQQLGFSPARVHSAGRAT